MTASRAMLEVRDLTLQIGRRTLIRKLSLTVNAGEVWCLLGANGAGKTMLFNTLVGLHSAQRRCIRLRGEPLERWSAGDAARVRGFLPQTIHDAFSAPVLDVVLLGRHPHLSRWGWERDADREMALAALQAVDLADLAGRDITTLSGGERRRAAIAALLVQDAPLMLLDEPITHLDIHHQILVLEHLAGLALSRQKAVVFSIHDLNLAFRFATHALLFRDDGFVEHGPVEDVMTDAALSGAFLHPVAKMHVGRQTVFVAQ